MSRTIIIINTTRPQNSMHALTLLRLKDREATQTLPRHTHFGPAKPTTAPCACRKDKRMNITSFARDVCIPLSKYWFNSGIYTLKHAPLSAIASWYSSPKSRSILAEGYLLHVDVRVCRLKRLLHASGVIRSKSGHCNVIIIRWKTGSPLRQLIL